jgi:amidohydrolase
MSSPQPNPDLQRLIDLRRALHTRPELSGQEEATAARIGGFLTTCAPTAIETGLGGHGVAGIFDAPDAAGGPTVVLRAELDALPIVEKTGLPHASRYDGVAHLCGHDGHMAMLCGVAAGLRERPLMHGRLILLFQPAEETGQGARAVVADPRWRDWAPDRVFAVHNLPGQPLGRVLLKEGAFTAGSIGLEIRLTGRTSHAAYPEQGTSPADALGRLVTGLVCLPIAREARGELALVTVVHALLGKAAFGISPADATILATLRADRADVLTDLSATAADLAEREAAADGLACELDWVEEFPLTMNDPTAVAEAGRAADRAGLATGEPPESPFRWSEDFGWMSADVRGALIGLGSGEDQPVLHAPDFDFPGDLMDPGVRFWESLLVELGLR